MFCGAQVVCAQVTRDVNVSGAVRPNDNSFQLAITPSTINTLSQDTNITYTITYGANLGSPEQLIIEAEWGYATVGDAAIPTIDLVQINDGSATEGFAGTPAVIDKVNHKIRWTINSFPAHTDNQKVAFSMNTNF